MQHQLAAFIDDLRSTHGNNLVSVILYGSAASGDFVRHRSDYNILIALQKIGPRDLRNAHPSIREWHKLGHPVPVYFTVSELKNAADVFPIEFYEMERARKVLYGSDVLAGIEFSDANLRHQVEYELRSKLILLRRQYIPASESVDGLMDLMAGSLSSFTTLFRAVLLLENVDPPEKKHEVAALVAERYDLDGATFEKIFNIREKNFAGTLDEVSANSLFARYMEQIERVIDAVDGLGRATSSS